MAHAASGPVRRLRYAPMQPQTTGSVTCEVDEPATHADQIACTVPCWSHGDPHPRALQTGGGSRPGGWAISVCQTTAADAGPAEAPGPA